jgi:D-alanine--poly(phosphoribitol) ligase subunit 2
MHGQAQRAERITTILERRLGIRVGGPDTDLFAAGVLDSLSFINLLLHLESEFGITIPLDRIDLERFNTVNRIAAFVAHATGEPVARAVSSAG